MTSFNTSNQKKKRFLAPEGKKPAFFRLLSTLIFGYLSFALHWAFGLAAALSGLLLLLTLWFYRDPERENDAPKGAVLSSADGVVVEVIPGHTEHTGNTAKVGVFMSPLNVHVNRVPYAGKVTWTRYHPGKKWAASAPKASEINERFYMGLDTDLGPLAVCQIAGLLARRIVCRVKRGDKLERGERFGMILLGSKVDVYLPPSVTPTVKVGDRVTAGVTVIGRAES